MENKELKNVELININLLKPNEHNVRKRIEEDENWDTFVNSIKENGVLIPLLLRNTENDEFIILAGERRYRAAKQIGLKELPAIIYNGELEDEEIILIENVQRKEIDSIEQAEALRSLYEKYGSFAEVARRTGLSDSFVANLISMVSELTPAQVEAIKLGDMKKNIYFEAKRLRKINEKYFNMVMDSATKGKLDNPMRVRAITNFIKMNTDVPEYFIKEFIYNQNFNEGHINLLLTIDNLPLRSEIFRKIVEDEMSIQVTRDYINRKIYEETEKVIESIMKDTEEKEDEEIDLKKVVFQYIRSNTLTGPDENCMGDKNEAEDAILGLLISTSSKLIKTRDKLAGFDVRAISNDTIEIIYKRIDLVMQELDAFKSSLISEREKERRFTIIEGYKE